jgi:chromosome segregation ATPase
MLDSLNQKIKETESVIQAKTHGVSEAEEKERSLEKEIESLDGKLDEKNEFLKQVGEIEKIGFDIERLRQLKHALTEIGAKYGLKGKEALAKFFDDLRDYDTKMGLEVEIQRLETLAETRKLEAERWQAEAEKTERQFKQLKSAIDAVQALLKRGVKPSEIASWHNRLAGIGGVEEFEKGLKRYSTIERLLAAKKREGKYLDTKVVELNSKVNTLKEQKTEIEASIKALRNSAVTEIEKVAQTGIETLKAQRAETEESIKRVKTLILNEVKEVSQMGVEKIGEATREANGSLQQTGGIVFGELKEALSLIDSVSARALEVGKTIGQIESKLDKSRETKERTEALVAAIEKGK